MSLFSVKYFIDSQMWKISKTLIRERASCTGLHFSIYTQLMRKHLSGAVTNNADRRNASAYRNEGVFDSKTLLAKHLKENILYDGSKSSGLVVVNKPFGLSLLPGETEEVSLNCALPELASILNVSNISVIKSCGRFISGCTLLNTGDDSTLKHMTKCKNRNRNQRKLSNKYLAITNGIPRTSGVLEYVDVSLETIKTKKSLKGGEFKEPVINREFVSQTRLRRSKEKDSKFAQITRISVVADIIARSRGNSCALVSIQPTDIQWNFLCAYMANLLSPIIGDSQFSYRVKPLFGKLVKVSHENSPVGHNSNNLPRFVLEQLGLTPNEQDHLPVHLHHYRTHLPDFFGNEDLTIYAPLPKYFECTANALQISLDAKELKDSDKIIEHNLPKRKDRSGIR